jgi:hypothetical protein
MNYRAVGANRFVQVRSWTNVPDFKRFYSAPSVQTLGAEKQGAAISKSPFWLVGGLETAVPCSKHAPMYQMRS